MIALAGHLCSARLQRSFHLTSFHKIEPGQPRVRGLPWLAIGGIAMSTQRLGVAAVMISLYVCHPAMGQAPNVANFPLKDGLVAFVMPSQNIECTFIPRRTAIYIPRGGGPELICDRRDPSYVRVIIGPSGAAERIDNSGERPCCGADNILQYGQTWIGGPFTCRSYLQRLSCRHKNGHGFSMNAKMIVVR